jgi:predicted Ser/Thr protein kinase
MKTTSNYKTIDDPIIEVVYNELQFMYPSFEIAGFIGKGTYGKVYYCLIEETLFALKIQKQHTENNMLVIQDFISSCSDEIEKMLYLDPFNLSPHVHFYKFFYNPSKKLIYNIILMEHLNIVDQMIESSIVNPVEIVTKVIEASNKLIGLGVSHRDFKWSNIGCRIQDDGTMSIIPLDFGLSKSIKSESFMDRETSINMDRLLLISSAMCLDIENKTKQIIFNLLRTNNMPNVHMRTSNDITKVQHQTYDLYLSLFNSTK